MNIASAVTHRPVESQRIAELRVLRAEGPRGERWRWDITWQSAVEGRNPGVYDARWHVAGNFGYTRTKWGAWRAVRKAYERR